MYIIVKEEIQGKGIQEVSYKTYLKINEVNRLREEVIQTRKNEEVYSYCCVGDSLTSLQ